MQLQGLKQFIRINVNEIKVNPNSLFSNTISSNLMFIIYLCAELQP